jgi:hypothetical protein
LILIDRYVPVSAISNDFSDSVIDNFSLFPIQHGGGAVNGSLVSGDIELWKRHYRLSP